MPGRSSTCCRRMPASTSWSLAPRPRYDAVVHFAAIPAILVRPDNETFRINVLSTYNVIDAAVKLGLRKVVFASSETTYGICFADGEVRPEYVPIDEEHPTLPHDSYAMSKVVNELTARSFQARSGIDIYGLRINNVIEPHEYEIKFPAFVADPGLRRRNIFGYIDARDLGHMIDCCLRTDRLGYEVSTSRTTTRRSGCRATTCTSASTLASRVDGTWVAMRRSTPTTRQSDRRICSAAFVAQRARLTTERRTAVVCPSSDGGMRALMAVSPTPQRARPQTSSDQMPLPRRQIARPERKRPGTLDEPVEARPQRLRHHLRRPLSSPSRRMINRPRQTSYTNDLTDPTPGRARRRGDGVPRHCATTPRPRVADGFFCRLRERRRHSRV